MSSFGFLGQPPSPEEYEKLMEEQKKAHERMQMRAEDYRKRVERLFGELPVEHLVTLNELFSSLATIPHARSYASWLQGQTTAVLQHVHKVCAGCGKDHLLEELDDDHEPIKLTDEKEEEQEP